MCCEILNPPKWSLFSVYLLYLIVFRFRLIECPNVYIWLCVPYKYIHNFLFLCYAFGRPICWVGCWCVSLSFESSVLELYMFSAFMDVFGKNKSTKKTNIFFCVTSVCLWYQCHRRTHTTHSQITITLKFRLFQFQIQFAHLTLHVTCMRSVSIATQFSFPVAWFPCFHFLTVCMQQQQQHRTKVVPILFHSI